jgi:hypothetical protein
MPCKNCNSTRQQTFPCELTLAFPGKQRLNLAPVYIFQKIFVCLDCGHADVEIPAAQLEELSKGMGEFQPTGESAR